MYKSLHGDFAIVYLNIRDTSNIMLSQTARQQGRVNFRHVINNTMISIFKKMKLYTLFILLKVYRQNLIYMVKAMVKMGTYNTSSKFVSQILSNISKIQSLNFVVQ